MPARWGPGEGGASQRQARGGTQLAHPRDNARMDAALGSKVDPPHRPVASQRSLAIHDVEAIVARRLAEMKPCEENGPRLNKSPFTEDIQAEVLPVGTTDPVHHLVQFENTILLHNFSDAMYCKAFATTLRSTTRTWFHQLPSSSISSFT